MNNFFEELKKYLENTPQTQIVSDWAKSEEFDKKGSTVEEFLRNTKKYCVTTEEPLDCCHINNNNHLSPKFTSGFLFI